MSLQTILTMLTYKRPAGSITEQQYIERFIVPTGAKPDVHGNYILDIGQPRYIFTSHTDSVHVTAGRQKITHDKKTGIVSLHKGNRFECLGADDAAGNYVMLRMIEAGVPGRYIFFREEEIGGIGSSAYARDNELELQKFDFAIAFDRKGKTDIITHQYGGRCASNAFADALAAGMEDYGLGLYASPNGSFTDTANFMELIPECSNLAVGYASAHSPSETLDLVYLMKLANACVSFDWSTLPIVRDPSLYQPSAKMTKSRDGTQWFDSGNPWDDMLPANDSPKYNVRRRTQNLINDYSKYGESTEPINWQDLFDLCSDDPEVVADILYNFQVSASDLQETIELYRTI